NTRSPPSHLAARPVCIKYAPNAIASYFYFVNKSRPSEPFTLSLHDALPISNLRPLACKASALPTELILLFIMPGSVLLSQGLCRSEEHTSELQSRFDLVCRLLLEKKKP